MALSNFSLPDIAGGDLDSQKERRRIMEYLYQLSEQLRFMMGNIGEENLSDELRGTIKDASCQVGELNRQLTDATGRMTSQIRQQADEIALKVSQSTYDSEKVIRSATAPENPTTHMLWLDISLSPNMLKRWTGSTWAIAGTNAVTASGITIRDDNVTISTPNFNLEILDASGDPVLTMSAGDAGFDKLYADKIVSDSTASMGPKKTVTYTVGSGGQFDSISDCLDNLPNIQRGTVIIQLVSNITENVRIVNRIFNTISLNLNGYTLKGYIEIESAKGRVYVQNGKIVDTRTAYSTSQYTLAIDSCKFNFTNLTINTNGATSRAIYIRNSSGWVQSCDINANYGSDSLGCSVICVQASQVYVSGTKGTARNGVVAYSGSIIMLSGSVPYGAAAAYVEQSGKVFDFGSTPTQTAQGGAVAVPVTASFTSTGGGSVRAGDLYQESDVFQGAYTSGKYKRGMWFFDYSAIKTALSGKTIQKVTFTCRRYATANGSASPQQPTFYLHNYTALPNAVPSFSGTAASGVAWDRGDTKTITLPNSFGEALKAGTAKGIAIAAPNNSSPYLKFYPTGAVLTITYV
ncbi:hypothetical protein [Oscillibacter sp.]|uniref:hypothetical protein n=2 Tax=Oscillibacter sp. TaxID=1945593 RepID=UPI001B54BF16|nr:hypothetical protein [Oscillibacter sp.]MBP3508734.1 hypothetical protein [Oscillibacter sp.]